MEDMEATLRPSTVANGVCRGDEGLNFDTVCVDVGVNRKRVLWNVSGCSPPGQVLAVMGASGELTEPPNPTPHAPVRVFC